MRRILCYTAAMSEQPRYEWVSLGAALFLEPDGTKVWRFFSNKPETWGDVYGDMRLVTGYEADSVSLAGSLGSMP